jgi:hypothetical protein
MNWVTYRHLWWDVFVLYALPVLLTAALFIACVLVLRAVVRSWRAAQRIIAITQAGGRNPDCRWCSLAGRTTTGCTCTQVCTYEKCIGDHTSLQGLSASDMELLQKWIKEGR